MSDKIVSYKRFIFAAIIIIAIGISLSTQLTDNAIGTVLIAVGGLFFIIGMSKKNQGEQPTKED